MGIHFVSEDEVSEESDVGIGKVEGLMKNHVWVVSKRGVEGVVLQVGSVQMLSSEFVASILSDDAFEVVHSEEIGIVPGRSFKSNREASVCHLVISLIEERWGEKRLFTVRDFTDSGSRD